MLLFRTIGAFTLTILIIVRPCPVLCNFVRAYGIYRRPPSCHNQLANNFVCPLCQCLLSQHLTETLGILKRGTWRPSYTLLNAHLPLPIDTDDETTQRQHGIHHSTVGGNWQVTTGP